MRITGTQKQMTSSKADDVITITLQKKILCFFDTFFKKNVTIKDRENNISSPTFCSFCCIASGVLAPLTLLLAASKSSLARSSLRFSVLMFVHSTCNETVFYTNLQAPRPLSSPGHTDALYLRRFLVNL